MSFDDDEPQEEIEPAEEYDWRNYGDQSASTDLDGTDIVAIFIASLQTIFLPIVILAVAMLAIGIVIGLIF